MARRTPFLLLAALILSMTAATSSTAADLRVGVIGLDTSHAQEFTARLNDPANPSYVPGARVVAAFPVSSADLPNSAERIEGLHLPFSQRDLNAIAAAKGGPAKPNPVCLPMCAISV